MPTAPDARQLLARRFARKFATFAVVGGLSTALHYCIAALLIWLAATPPVPASTVGFVVAAVFNYAANARFTFGADPLRSTPSLKFAVAAASGCALNAILLEAGLRLGLPVVVSQLAATALVLVWNFALNAAWVFRDGDAA